MTDKEMADTLQRIVFNSHVNLDICLKAMMAVTLLKERDAANEATTALETAFPGNNEIATIVATLRERYGL